MRSVTVKITSVLLIAALSIFVLFATGCSSADFAAAAEKITGGYSASNMAGELEAFLSACPDRTSLSKDESPEEGNGESAAAEYIASRLETLTGTRGDIRTFRQRLYGDEFASSNVVYTVKASEANNPEGCKVIIGAHYDNTYLSSPMGGEYRGYDYFMGTKAEGAMSEGTSVAIMLRMCEYFAQISDELTVDIDFVFYGMGCIEYSGAQKYYESLGETGRSKIKLVVTLDNIGGDDLYMYFDEAPTSHGKFMMGVARSVGYGDYVSEPPAMQTDLPFATVDSLPYTPYALLNDSSVYFDNENVCVMTSGSDNTFLLYRQNGYGKADISGASSDTLENLSQKFPGYADQMSVVADLLTKTVTYEGFAEACGEGRSVSYGFWTSALAAYIVCAVLGLALFGVTLAVVSKLRKKYAEPSAKHNIKIAVFGMDYEEPKDGDIFFDIHSGNEDPFSDAFDDDKSNADNKDGGSDKKDDDKKGDA